jgi:thioredoxin 2
MKSNHIVCPHCNTVNRIATDRLPEKPLCGKCKQALFMARPLDLTAGNFQQHISRSDIPIIIDFWAPWCGPCKMMAPAFAKAAVQIEPRGRLAKLNTEQEQTIAAQFSIRSIPTMVIFKGGQEIIRQSGAMSETDIVRWINSNI